MVCIDFFLFSRQADVLEIQDATNLLIQGNLMWLQRWDGYGRLAFDPARKPIMYRFAEERMAYVWVCTFVFVIFECLLRLQDEMTFTVGTIFSMRYGVIFNCHLYFTYRWLSNEWFFFFVRISNISSLLWIGKRALFIFYILISVTVLAVHSVSTCLLKISFG